MRLTAPRFLIAVTLSLAVGACGRGADRRGPVQPGVPGGAASGPATVTLEEAAPTPVQSAAGETQATGPYVQELGPFRRPAPEGVDQAPEDRPAWVAAERANPGYLHRGLYLRFSGGLGVGRERGSADTFRFRTETDTLDGGEYSGRGSAYAVATGVALGYTARYGITIAFSLDTATLPELVIEDRAFSDEEVSQAADARAPQSVSQLAVAGPLIDWFVDPDLGFHVGASFGVASYVSGQSFKSVYPRARGHTSIGLGLVLNLGYDFWVAEEWSVGLLGRIYWANVNGDDPDSNRWNHKLLVPAALLSLTYN